MEEVDFPVFMMFFDCKNLGKLRAFFKPPKRRFFCAIYTIAMRRWEMPSCATNEIVVEILVRRSCAVLPCHDLALAGVKGRTIAYTESVGGGLQFPDVGDIAPSNGSKLLR
jgi:hypothetical protein